MFTLNEENLTSDGELAGKITSKIAYINKTETERWKFLYVVILKLKKYNLLCKRVPSLPQERQQNKSFVDPFQDVRDHNSTRKRKALTKTIFLTPSSSQELMSYKNFSLKCLTKFG